MDYPIVDTKDGKPVYSMHWFPPELGTKAWWAEMGYSPADDNIFMAWVLLKYYQKTPQYTPLYKYDQVQPLPDEPAIEKRQNYEKLCQKWDVNCEIELRNRIYRACEGLLKYWDSINLFPTGIYLRSIALRDFRRNARDITIGYVKQYRSPNPAKIENRAYEILEELYGGTITIYAVRLNGGIEIEFTNYWDAYHYLMAILIPPAFRNVLFELEIEFSECKQNVIYKNPEYLIPDLRGKSRPDVPIEGCIVKYTILRDI